MNFSLTVPRDPMLALLSDSVLKRSSGNNCICRLFARPLGIEMLYFIMKRGVRMESATPEERAEAYRQANASLALEGMHMTPEDLALQQRVIDGEWTSEQYHEYVRTMPKKRNVA